MDQASIDGIREDLKGLIPALSAKGAKSRHRLSRVCALKRAKPNPARLFRQKDAWQKHFSAKTYAKAGIRACP
jgi:hypothetical protein